MKNRFHKREWVEGWTDGRTGGDGSERKIMDKEFVEKDPMYPYPSGSGIKRDGK